MDWFTFESTFSDNPDDYPFRKELIKTFTEPTHLKPIADMNLRLILFLFIISLTAPCFGQKSCKCPKSESRDRSPVASFDLGGNLPVILCGASRLEGREDRWQSGQLLDCKRNLLLDLSGQEYALRQDRDRLYISWFIELPSGTLAESNEWTTFIQILQLNEAAKLNLSPRNFVLFPESIPAHEAAFFLQQLEASKIPLSDHSIRYLLTLALQNREEFGARFLKMDSFYGAVKDEASLRECRSLYEQAPEKNTYRPDRSLSSVQLFNNQSLKELLGDQPRRFLEEDDGLPMIQLRSEDKTRLISMSRRLGYRDERIIIFRLEQISANLRFGKYVLTWTDEQEAENPMQSGLGIRLGMSPEEVMALAGLPKRWDNPRAERELLVYHNDDPADVTAAQLGLRRYFALYRFRHGRLVSMEYGFE